MIGIVDMYVQKLERGISDILRDNGYQTVVLDAMKMTGQAVAQSIARSTINRWIFTGSNGNVHDDDAPVVPLEIVTMPKSFLLICYSMESILYQMDKHILVKRPEVRREEFKMERPMALSALFHKVQPLMSLQRNHRYYIETGTMQQGCEIASHQGEVMIGLYENCVLVQYHPERTPDGLLMIKNWFAMGTPTGRISC